MNKSVSSPIKFAYPTVIINFNTHRLKEIGGNSSVGPSDDNKFEKMVKLYVDSLRKRREEYYENLGK